MLQCQPVYIFSRNRKIKSSFLPLGTYIFDKIIMLYPLPYHMNCRQTNVYRRRCNRYTDDTIMCSSGLMATASDCLQGFGFLLISVATATVNIPLVIFLSTNAGAGEDLTSRVMRSQAVSDLCISIVATAEYGVYPVIDL